jgi:hypothetical protein
MRNNLKKLEIFCFLLLFISFRVSAPCWQDLPVSGPNPSEPYKKLLNAVAMVETSNDTLAYNPLEEASGILQIRPVRLVEYNRRTGSNYTRKDLFSYEVSEKIFMYFASEIGPYNLEKIARNWNGSGKMTDNYWKRVKNFL